MRGRLFAVAVLMLMALTAAGAGQTPGASVREPDFRVQVWGDAEADFIARVEHYAELRSQLQAGLPVLPRAADPVDIVQSQRSLARSLRSSRQGVIRGNIFSPAISTAFRAELLPALDAETLTAIMDENPGEFPNRVDSTYPQELALSTVPANILALLPRLPQDIQYRFLGRHLILHDARANTIVDQLTCAIACRANTP